MAPTQLNKVLLPKSGINVFYREQGDKNAPVFLLLHGFPASSFQYRNLIPILATKYRVVAPDLPGFGFTDVPSGYKNTFENLTNTVEEFLDVLDIAKFSVYIFDYGAPTALRLALRRPSAIEGIVSQNGNAYVEGLGEFWNPLRDFWTSPNGSDDHSKVQAALLTYEATRFQYDFGTPDPTTQIAPESYTLDWALMQRPGNFDVQLDLFFDYQNNVELYPQFQEYFRKSQVPLLAIWGKKDPIFVYPGAEAFKKDLPNAEVRLLDAGHFAVESNTEEIGKEILRFFSK